MTSATAVSSRSPVRACFDLARAGNFPSVASNVLAALVLSGSAGPVLPAGERLGLAVLAGCLIYAGGATFNDVADARFDAAHRPERPIPSRVVTRSAAGGIGALEMILGSGILVAAGASVAWAAALAATIVAYDWIHKRWSGSVILMAGCRGLLAITIASLPGQLPGTAFWWWVGVLFFYIVTLSLIARREYGARPTASGATAGTAPGNRDAAPPRYSPKRGLSVGRLLAFIPLIDAIALLVVGAWIPALICAAAVPLGRWAQRLAAAT